MSYQMISFFQLFQILKPFYCLLAHLLTFAIFIFIIFCTDWWTEIQSIVFILLNHLNYMIIISLQIRPDIKSRNIEMRNQLDLFVNVLHCTSKKGVKTRHDDIDICVIRQNTQGRYAFDFYLNLAEYNKILSEHLANKYFNI